MRKTIFASLLALMMLITSSLALANGDKVRKGVVDLDSDAATVSIEEMKEQSKSPAIATDDAVVLSETKKKLVQPVVENGVVSLVDAKNRLAAVNKETTVTLNQARIALAKSRGLPDVKGEWFRLGKDFSGADTISEIVVKACLKNFTVDVLADNALTWEQATKLQAGFEFFVRREFLKDEFNHTSDVKFRQGDEVVTLSKEVAELKEQLLAEAAVMEIAKDQIATLTDERDGLQIALQGEQQKSAEFLATIQKLDEEFAVSEKMFAELSAQNTELKNAVAVNSQKNEDEIEMASCHQKNEVVKQDTDTWTFKSLFSKAIKSLLSSGPDTENAHAAVFTKGGGSILLAGNVASGDYLTKRESLIFPTRFVDDVNVPAGQKYRVRTIDYSINRWGQGRLPALLPKARSGPEVRRC